MDERKVASCKVGMQLYHCTTSKELLRPLRSIFAGGVFVSSDGSQVVLIKFA